jgi:hypothetical protein
MSWLRLGGGRREAAIALVLCVGTIAVAVVLPPDPRGYGTHTRLLRVPCTFRAITRLPCPLCGMTTGFADMARGRVRAAVNANVMAPAGFVATCLLGLLALYGTVSGRGWLPAALNHPAFASWFLGAILAFWVINLALHFGGWHV